jgi:hypothetical protein
MLQFSFVNQILNYFVITERCLVVITMLLVLLKYRIRISASVHTVLSELYHILLSPSGHRIPRCLKIVHDRFLPQPYQFTNHPTIR